MERQILSVVRCPALGGVAVPTYNCTGFDSVQACPYFTGATISLETGVTTGKSSIACGYRGPGSKKPADPLTRRPYSNRRDNPQLPKEMRPKPEDFFSLQLSPQLPGLAKEWKNARVNSIEGAKNDN